MNLRIAMFGDVVGKFGRDLLLESLPVIKEKWQLDFVSVNAENAAHGFGINRNIAEKIFLAGADVITTGNHAFDKRDIESYFLENNSIIKPFNWVSESIGAGFVVKELDCGRKILAINLMAQVFMKYEVDNPFLKVDELLKKYRLNQKVNAIVIDFHGEAASEKQAMGHYLDGRVSLICGTHEHTPTADTQILKGGTGYQTDIGMCGVYDSIIGMEKSACINRALGIRKEKFEPAKGDASLSGVIAEINEYGHCVGIKHFVFGKQFNTGKDFMISI